MRKNLLVGVVLFGWFLFELVRAPFWGTVGGAQDTPRPQSVRFEMLASNHMVVRAKLNGKGPYRLIFDLGSPVTLLSGKAAEESGAIPKSAPRSFLFGVRGEGKLKSIELGDVRGKDLPVVVMDHPALKALSGFWGRPLDGILGYTFFARYKTTINYEAKELTFEPVEFEVGDMAKDLQARMLGPRTAKSRVLAALGLWGLVVKGPAEGADAAGVTVTTVHPGSPAEAAGVAVGDVLLSIDGRWTTTPTDAHEAAATIEPGQSVPVVVVREGHERTLTVTPVAGL